LEKDMAAGRRKKSNRKYSLDFEKYYLDGKVEIYIAVL
jgi:predicted transcriptional regulator YdeE